MGNPVVTVLFEGAVLDGEYRVSLSKNARTYLLLEKKTGVDVHGAAQWERIQHQADDSKYLHVIVTALAAIISKDA